MNSPFNLGEPKHRLWTLEQLSTHAGRYRWDFEASGWGKWGRYWCFISACVFMHLVDKETVHLYTAWSTIHNYVVHRTKAMPFKLHINFVNAGAVMCHATMAHFISAIPSLLSDVRSSLVPSLIYMPDNFCLLRWVSSVQNWLVLQDYIWSHTSCSCTDRSCTIS